MKTIIQSLIVTIIISTGIISCTKNSSPYELQEMYECHEEMGLDSIAIVDKILGEWRLDYTNCYFNPEYKDKSELKRSIEFLKDHTLIVKEKGEIVKSSDWYFDGTYLRSEDYTVHGVLYFCDDYLSIVNSYVDGCDDYYQRKD